MQSCAALCRRGLASLLLLTPDPGAVAQAPRPDYARAEQFFSTNLEKRIFGDKIEPHWLKEGNRFWYRVKTVRGPEFYMVYPSINSRKPLFDNAR
jgi:dipeptidyl-peptidase 4